MNERIKELMERSMELVDPYALEGEFGPRRLNEQKFAELIVKEMCGLMEQAEDDAYDCFEPSERSTEYIGWLFEWRERFEKHFGVEE